MLLPVGVQVTGDVQPLLRRNIYFDGLNTVKPYYLTPVVEDKM